MSFKSILVNLDIDGPTDSVIMAACDLAQRLQARLIGLCAADAAIPSTYPEVESMAIEAWQQLWDDIETRFKELHADFDRLVAGSVEAEWRESLGFPTGVLTGMAKAADLVVLGATKGAASGNLHRAADPGSVILEAGRPALILASGADRVPLERAVVTWKDTREARRAVADAVPLLSFAREVTVATVAATDEPWVHEGIADVVAFLSRHEIQARPEVIEGTDEVEKLTEFLAMTGADFVVSGAYGHSRLREWAFGGITRSLLDKTGIDRFMSS